jgi:hypothetical protein
LKPAASPNRSCLNSASARTGCGTCPPEDGAGASPKDVVRQLIEAAVEHSADNLRNDATLIYLR